MQARLFLMLSVTLVCGGECVQVEPQPPTPNGRVEVVAVDILGEPLRNLTVDLIQVGSGKSFTSEFRDGVANRIPYGQYTARISAPGFRSVERVLRLAQPEVSLRTQLSVSVECGSAYAGVYGSIQPAPGDRELWVKVVPVLGSGGGEVRVSRTGAFQLAGLDDGDYLLLVLDGKTIIHTGNAPTNRVVNIDLRQR